MSKKISLIKYNEDKGEILFSDKDGNELVFQDVKKHMPLFTVIVMKSFGILEQPEMSDKKTGEFIKEKLIDQLIKLRKRK